MSAVCVCVCVCANDYDGGKKCQRDTYVNPLAVLFFFFFTIHGCHKTSDILFDGVTDVRRPIDETAADAGYNIINIRGTVLMLSRRSRSIRNPD